MAKNKMPKIDKISDLPFFGDPRFTHWKCCCGGIHVFVFLLIVAAVFLVVELITFCDKLTAKESKAAEFFFGVLGLLLFGIMKQSRKVLLAFLVVLAMILTVDTVLFIINNPFGSLTGDLDLVTLVEELEAEADGITRSTTTTTETPDIEIAGFNFAIFKFILHSMRIIIGIYLFVVIINYRQYLTEWKKVRDAEKASKRRCISCNKKIEAKNEAKKSKEMLKNAAAQGDPEKGIVKSGKVGKKGKTAKKASEKGGVFATISAMTDTIPLEVKEEMKETAIAIGKSAFSELTGVTAEDTKKIIDSALANSPPAKNGKKVQKTAKNSMSAKKKNKKKTEPVEAAQVGSSVGKKSAKPSRASSSSAQSKIATMASFAMPLLSRITRDDDDDSGESEDETDSEDSEVEDEVIDEDEEEMEESDTEEEDAEEEEDDEEEDEEQKDEEENEDEEGVENEDSGGFVAVVVDEDDEKEKK